MLLNEKFNLDLLWNILSLIILGISGIIINTFIAKFYGAGILGAYNQVFAIYIFFSQFAIGGMHFSVLKNISYNQGRKDKIFQITISGLLLALILSLIFAVILLSIKHFIGNLLFSYDVEIGIALVAPGLIFFSINKIFLSVLNALELMKAYAIFQALRYLLILFSVICLYKYSFPGNVLPLSFTLAEIILSIGLSVYTFKYVFNKYVWSNKDKWFSKHLLFGIKGFMSGALSELNSRIDVLSIGYFLSDSMVGIYSYAAILSEGIAQISMVMRRNIDPIIGSCFSLKNFNQIEIYSKNLKLRFPLMILFVSMLTSLLLHIFLKYFIDGNNFEESLLIFILIALGVVFNSVYRPFLGILLQGNKPEYHTLLTVILVLFNVVGNIILIPILGIYGAAITTSLVYAIESSLIKYFSKKLFSINL